MKECNITTPMNTIGIGNVDIENGSDGIGFVKKSKHKSLKDYILKKLLKKNEIIA